MKFIDAFLVMTIPTGRFEAVRTLWRPDMPFLDDENLSINWLEAYRGETEFCILKGLLLEDDYAISMLNHDANTIGVDFDIMRVRVFEDGAIEIFGKAEPGMVAKISDSERPKNILEAEDVYRAHGLKAPIPAPSFEGGSHTCRIEVVVTNESDLSAFLKSNKSISASSIRKVFFSRVFKKEHGVRLEAVDITTHSLGFEISLRVKVHDARILNQIATISARKTGMPADWHPQDASQAIYEAWLGDPNTPNLETIGLSVVSIGQGEALEVSVEELEDLCL